jgi:hypothetical protein
MHPAESYGAEVAVQLFAFSQPVEVELEQVVESEHVVVTVKEPEL